MIKPRIGRSLAVLALATLATTACSPAGATVIVTTTITSSTGAVQPSGPSHVSSAGESPSTGTSGIPSASDVPSPQSGSAGGTTNPSGAAGAGGATASNGIGGAHETPSPTAPSSATPTSATPKPVHVSTFEGDGKTYGVGMAVMVLFSRAPTDSAAFTHAATVTVNGTSADGAWFWQTPTVPGYKLEALYREKDYWPAHSTIEVDLPVDGLSAGPGLVYDDSLTVSFRIGAAHVSHVDNAQHSMVVTSDGNVIKNFPVSLGSASTPTYDGTKVVMEKDNPVRMKSEPGDPDPYNILVPWSVRITNSGEFIHAASWNTGNIGSRNTSHGCTNLDMADAEWFYHFSQIGDVVDYPDANPDGTMQPSWDGWGWWNLSWSQWSRGGVLLNH